MRNKMRICLLLILAAANALAFAQKSVTIGIITDSPTQQTLIPVSLLQEEIDTLTVGEFVVNMPQNKRVAANGTVQGVKNAIVQQLNDPDVDLIITLGLVSSQQIAQTPELNKPVIAAFVLDRELQGFPYQFGVSGKHNLAYLTTQKSIAEDLTTFHEMVQFKHLAVLMNPFWLETLPQLKRLLAQTEKQNGIQVTVIPANSNINTMLNAMPSNTDAVYVAPLLSFSENKMRDLAQQLIARGLPSFSSKGQQDVEFGFLAAMGGLPEDKVRFARRIALDVQSILLGDEPGDLNVIFDANPKMTLNMETARAIGFSPSWRYLLEATLLNAQEAPKGEKLTLTDAMHKAINANLELQVNELSLDVAEENVELARAKLLPQLIAQISNQQVDANDPLQVIGVAQNMTMGSLAAQQSLYSENFWANFRISQYLEDAEDFRLYGQMLDTLEKTGTAYVNVLRAEAVREVQVSNLQVTELNLNLARTRERVGFSSRADVLRWESQLSLDQQSVLQATSQLLQAKTELNRLLSLPQEENFSIDDLALGQFATLMDTRTLAGFIGTPYSWQLFQKFAVTETLNNAPELGEIEALIEAKEREQLASRRAFYVPDFALEGGIQQVLSKSGTGSDFAAEGISETQWQVSVNATLPLLMGGARQAKLTQTGYEVEQLNLQNQDAQEKLEKRTRDILYQMGESYPGIELSSHAAQAALENLSLVTDRYQQGDVDITDLIDAQNTALSAQLDQAQSRYGFLNDFIALLRSTGDLILVLNQNSLEHWFDRIDYFYEEEAGANS